MSRSSLHVMVVEDHGFQRRMALRLLATLGIDNVCEAIDGGSGLSLLEDMTHVPDVVLVDLDMPGMDGVQFIGHVAERRLARAVVVVSALDPALLNTVQTMARGYGLRVLGSVEKPLTADKLATVLARYDDTTQADESDEAIEVAAADVRAALEGGQIVPWFQPQVEFGNGKPIAVEALARWVQPDGRVIRPMNFIQVIEREGLADRLTDHMLQQGCQWQQRWRQQGLQVNLSINVSPLTLSAPGVADRFERLVLTEGVRPSEVMLEITESSVMADAAHALGVLARLRLKGFGLSIDDFGTGYSSMGQLSHIPFTELKIDRGFVSGAHAQPRKRAVVETSLDLARKLGLNVVAEGVETVEDWQMLAELGCGIAQGYLIARPEPGAALIDAIARWRCPEYG